MAAGNSVMDEIREQHKKMKGKRGLPEGSHLGLKGENLCVKDLER